MKKYELMIFVMFFVSALFMPIAGDLWAREKGITPEEIKDAYRKNAYRQVLTAADKNSDGKLSMQECLTMLPNIDMKESCHYWDTNSDGIITENEYVQQVKNARHSAHPETPVLK